MKQAATSVEAVVALERVVVASVAITARALADVAPELTIAQWRVLVLIDRPDGLTVSFIASALGAKVPAVSRLLGRLRERGLIQTQRDAHDARLVFASLTKAGRDIRSRVMARRRADLLMGLDQMQLPRDAEQVIDQLAIALEAIA